MEIVMVDHDRIGPRNRIAKEIGPDLIAQTSSLFTLVWLSMGIPKEIVVFATA
jgi:hypothetical protein